MPSDPVTLVHRYFEELLNQRRTEVAEGLLAPDIVWRSSASPQPIHGREAVLGYLSGIGAAFPDGRFTVGPAIAEGDLAACPFTFEGTHHAEYQGLPASGRRVVVEGVDLFRVADGRIAEIRVHMDVFGMLLQLGAAGMPAPLQANRELVRRYLQDVVSGGDVDAAERYLADDLVFTSPYTPEPIRGLAGFKAMIGGLHAAFPDMRLDEEASVAEGDLVATRWRVSGTHTGPFGELPASGRRFSITGMSFYRVRGGRIVEGWVDDDTLAMAEQLGALAPAAEAV